MGKLLSRVKHDSLLAKTRNRRIFFWILGFSIALIGVGITRVHLFVQFLETYHSSLLVFGTVIAFFGLWVFTKGSTHQPQNLPLDIHTEKMSIKKNSGMNFITD